MVRERFLSLFGQSDSLPASLNIYAEAQHRPLYQIGIKTNMAAGHGKNVQPLFLVTDFFFFFKTVQSHRLSAAFDGNQIRAFGGKGEGQQVTGEVEIFVGPVTSDHSLFPLQARNKSWANSWSRLRF